MSYDKVKISIIRDDVEYIFESGLGCMFASYSLFKPNVNDEITLFGKVFRPFRYYVEKRLFKFIKIYKICWVSTQINSYEELAEFYYNNMLKQLPNGTKLDCLKNCIKQGIKGVENE